MFHTLQFVPHPLLRNGHAQTVYAGLWSSTRIAYRAQPHIIGTTDDDQLVLHDDCPASWSADGRCALLVHGLGGSHLSPYMIRTAHKLNERGVRAFRLDLRGSGAGDRLARKPGHAGRSEDVAAAARHVTQCCPKAEVVVIGYSLGANILLKLLGEWADRTPAAIARAIAVSPPIDLLACSRNMGRRSMALYNRWYVRSLIHQSSSRRAYVPELDRLDWSHPPDTLFDFDDRVTAPLSGFSGALEYYARSSAAPLLRDIHVPTTILAAADDPIVPARMFDNIIASPRVTLRVTRHGGHVAFIGRAGLDPDRYWLDWRVVDFVTEK